MSHLASKKKKIAVNCWVLRNKQLDGIGYFTVNTLQQLIALHSEVDFVMLCDKNYNESYFIGENVTIQKVFPPYRHPLLYIFYLECILPFVLKRIKPDLMLSAEGFCSLFSSCPQLPIFYDLNFEHFPKNLALKNRLYFRYFFPRFARKATRIATISEYSKQDIVNFYKVDASNIDNVSCGIKPGFEKLNQTEIIKTRNDISKGNPYFFFVGSMHPRKNIDRLIEAFELFKTQSNANVKLVISGSIRWKSGAILHKLENSQYKEDIIFTGRISDEQLGRYLGSALALAFVPVFEGFGLPIVEAFQAGVPVVCSNVTSLPEVAGDAAIYVNPMNVNDIARGLSDMALMTEEERIDLIDKGDKRKSLFSWENTAKLMWDSIEKAIKIN